MLDTRHMFLLDGLGAFLTATTVGIVFPMIQPWIGMPMVTLFALGWVAMLFAAYSLGHYLGNHQWPGRLKLIMAGNSAYCLASAVLTVAHWQELTLLGRAYFIAEIIIVLGVVALEGRVLMKHLRQ